MSRRAKKNRQVRPQVTKPRKHETLEARVVMSADPLLGPIVGLHESPVVEIPIVTPHDLGPSLQLPVMDAPASEPDFWIDPEVSAELALDELDRMVDTMLREGHELTGQDDVIDRYGFTGAGQTVAVIDTGIAYNHYALGGGMGDGYRVVGGWDFAEGDADFNDDGGNSKAGHGTHVAGIVGASSGDPHQGVATGVDLVGLRVFDDSGAGYFSWIEQALQWVHTNRNAYDSPITTVNLSLGTTWNSDDNPGWAMLENEFAQLEADGIFISVSAGNSYEDFNANGVSYPASSDYVIPVMATKDDGSLAYFSQRATYAVGAPGWGITSTVPDHNANDADSIDDDWGVKYGTSMAAPYLAGASTLIREAMEFVGQTSIDQWDIYDHIMDTADSFYDSTSSTNYKRLNLEAAIDALMPVDDHGTSVATASNLGTLGEGSSSTGGVISTLDDGDYFTFTAGVSGVVTVSATNTTHDLTASWDAWGGDWTEQENGCQIDVVAGETYTVALSSSNGLGHYDLEVDVEAVETFTPVDWGAIGAQETRSWQPTDTEQWFSVTAGRTGYFTAEALPDSGTASVAIYDAQQNLLAAAGSRADYQATAGQTLLVRVTGDAPEFDVRMTNAFAVSGGVASLVGTTGDDAIEFTAGDSTHSLSLNGVAYSVSVAAISSVQITGDGSDALAVTGSAATERFELTPQGASVESDGFEVIASGFSSVVATAGSTSDIAILRDSAGDEEFSAYSDRATLEGDNFLSTAVGFSRVDAVATSGDDTAILFDTSGDDTVRAYESRVVFEGGGIMNRALGFGSVEARATTGNDTAKLYDTSGAEETFVAYSDRASLVGADFNNQVSGFDQVDAYSTGGGDTAELHDTAGEERFYGYDDRGVLEGAGFRNRAIGFSQIDAHASNDADRAFLFDSDGVDSYRAYEDRGVMEGAGYQNRALGFGRVDAYSSAGEDTASFYGSDGKDSARVYSDRVIMHGSGYLNRSFGFGQNDLWASGTTDLVQMYGTDGDDMMRAYSDRVVLEGDSYFNRAFGFERSIVYASGGVDRAYLIGSEADEILYGWSDLTRFKGAGFRTDAVGFDMVESQGNGGHDVALLIGDSSDNTASASGSTASLAGPDTTITVSDYDYVELRSGSGSDQADIEAVDFALAVTGDWA